MSHGGNALSNREAMKINITVKLVKLSGGEWDVVEVTTGNALNQFSFMSQTLAADWADERRFSENRMSTENRVNQAPALRQMRQNDDTEE
jgi:hypothetical protein